MSFSPRAYYIAGAVLAGIACVTGVLWYSSRTHTVLDSATQNSAPTNRTFSYTLTPGVFDLTDAFVVVGKVEITKSQELFDIRVIPDGTDSRQSVQIDAEWDIRKDFDGCTYAKAQPADIEGLPLFGYSKVSDYVPHVASYEMTCPNTPPQPVIIRNRELPEEVNPENTMRTFTSEVFVAEKRIKSYYLNFIYDTATLRHKETGYSEYNYINETHGSFRYIVK
jgi:hypothetical protein